MSTMKLTLVYPKMRALAEPARMTAAHAKVALIDSFPWDFFGEASWPIAKSKVPFGQLPMLVVEDKSSGKTSEICMSNAICRFIATIGAKIPADPADAAIVDSIGEKFHELFVPLNPICNFMKFYTPEKAEEALTKTRGCLTLLDPILAKSGGPFCMGQSAYYADFHVYHHVSLALMLDSSLLDNFPKVNELMKAVESLDGVKEYLAKRPGKLNLPHIPSHV